MIGWHCGKRVILTRGNRKVFRAICQVCKKSWTQRKRQPKRFTEPLE